MKHVISERRVRWQFRFHVLALCFLVMAAIYPDERMVRIAATAFTVSSALLAANVWSALALYRRVQQECAAPREATCT